ncbi:TPA: leucyl/phenylalanyl-tRNA--protein transferase, partial [Stenotrophomonas maltophilia]|nr:leucyl/phenylalanyl-tRNA--protein transferase [Stenotrophomonas maltophilia]
TEGVHLSSRFRRQLRSSTWEVTADTAFSRVMRACAAAPRPGQDGTWISPAMVEAYGQLHDLGFAHSFEVWDRQTLVGGIYGVAIGSMFFGESMFSGASGGSKIALAALASTLHGWGWELIDAQVENPHLLRMGAEHLPRAEFLQHVRRAVRGDGREGPWTQAVGRLPARRLAGG